jgi:LysM repeat protein
MRRAFVLSILAIVLLSGVVAATAQYGTTYYVVARGDTLARIASRFGVTVQEIASANGIFNVNLIYVGQQLIIPTFHYPPPPPPPPPHNPYYVVQRGDTLARIARWFGTTVYALQQANGIANPNLIYAGMVLYIPPATPPPPVSVTPYYVQYGDTLAIIAARFGTTVGAIVSYNGLANPNLIYAGMLLHIPRYY